MKKLFAAFIAILLLTLGSRAQDAYYSIFNFSHFIPKVGINDRSVTLQESLYPKYYAHHSASRDMRWVQRNDSLLRAFWEEKGDTVLHILTELSGIEWYEGEFDIYLVRFYPTLGSPDPLILPLGGMKNGELIEAAPSDGNLIFNLVYQLAHRMLAQTVQPEDSVYLRIADHPLMRPSSLRRDNLALLLTLSVCQNIMGIDSTEEIYQSAFWVAHTPGRKIFEEYFRNKWVLTLDHTLADWIAEEPYGSPLVVATRPPRPPKKTLHDNAHLFLEGLPLKGRLGFSVKRDESNYLVVDTIDIYRLAYACGLRVGDKIRTVDDYRVRNHRQLVEKILERLKEGEAATLQIVRDKAVETIVIQPMELPDTLYYTPSDSTDFRLEDYYREDTTALPQDSAIPVSPAPEPE